MLDFNDLDQEIKQWGDYDLNDPQVLEDWISAAGSLGLLAAYGTVFWPDFIEFDDCVFRKDSFSEVFYKAQLERSNGDKSAVEALMNHRHVLSLFGFTGDPAKDSSPELIRHVGRLLCTIWSTKLKRDFPMRNTKVEFVQDNVENPMDYQILIYTERQQL